MHKYEFQWSLSNDAGEVLDVQRITVEARSRERAEEVAEGVVMAELGELEYDEWLEFALIDVR